MFNTQCLSEEVCSSRCVSKLAKRKESSKKSNGNELEAIILNIMEDEDWIISLNLSEGDIPNNTIPVRDTQCIDEEWMRSIFPTKSDEKRST